MEINTLKEDIYKEEALKEKELEEKFLRLYENLKVYERENRFYIITLNFKKYLLLLREKIKILETLKGEEREGEMTIFLRALKRSFKESEIKLSSLNKENFALLEEGLIDEILLNLKYKTLEPILEYRENLKGEYIKHNEIRIYFGLSTKELKEEFLKKLKYLIEEENKRVKETLPLRHKSLLKELKGSLKEDVDLDLLKIIRDDFLDLKNINLKMFTLYKEYEDKIYESFYYNLKSFSLNNYNKEKKYLLKEGDYSSLNKRFLKLIEEFNKSFMKNRLLFDIENLINHESIERKMEIELLYALDFFKEKYTRGLEDLIKNLKEDLEKELYYDFQKDFGELSSLEEQKLILDSLYLSLKEAKLSDFSKVTLLHYLKHSKERA